VKNAGAVNDVAVGQFGFYMGISDINQFMRLEIIDILITHCLETCPPYKPDGKQAVCYGHVGRAIFDCRGNRSLQAFRQYRQYRQNISRTQLM